MKPFDLTRSFDRGLADLDRVHAWLDELPRTHPDFEAETLARLRLALAEAFANAVQHAHGGQTGLAVEVRISSDGDGLIRLDVSDCGPGFHLSAPPPPNDHAERGRGLGILHKLADRVVYERNTLSIWLQPRRDKKN